MDPVTLAIATALSAGAAFVLKEAASEAIKDAYGALKSFIMKHYPRVNVEQLEEQPGSEPRRGLVAEELESEGAFKDLELVRLAQTVAEIVKQQSPDAARAIGVDLGTLDQANVTFDNVLAGQGATGVKIDRVSGGTLHFGTVSASGVPDLPQQP